MRGAANTLLACLLGVTAIGGSSGPAAAQGEPPHAWLFGAWTGGLFPVPPGLTTQACLAQPVVIFTRDVVLRASLTDVAYSQRVVETARTTPGRTEFRLAPALDNSAGGLLDTSASKLAPGFGCENANVLHVVRNSDDQISFPGCSDFPEPLVRCR